MNTQINSRLQNRLTALKDYAAGYSEQSKTLRRWQDCRYISKHKNPLIKRSSLTRGKNGEYFIDSFAEFAGDFIGECHEINRHLPRGWFADNFVIETINGVVLVIRGRGFKSAGSDKYEDGSKVAFMAGIYWSNADGVTVYPKTFENEFDAARYADQCAERVAEDSREYHAKDQAEQQIDELKQDLHAINKQTLQLIRDIKTGICGQLPESIKRVIETAIKNAVDDKSRLYKRIADLKENYWLSVENW